MKHLGDITKISGYSAPIVDCVIGGSPCQDLSVAGRRAGLDGERSGLFMEQVRIVKEMRKRDERNGRTGVDVRPRYMVWENVPGAFSSNKGEDFRIVLEEIAKVAEKDAVIPMPNEGKWTTCGCIVADGWSIAWRVLDAQFWGVPQRRRRIALVADFGGQSAPEILLVRNSLSGHTESGKPKGKEPSTDASRGIGADDRLGADQYNAVILGDTVSTLGVNCGMSHGRQCVLEPKDVVCFEPGIASREGGHIYEGVCGTLRAKAGDNQMATAYTMQDREGKADGGKGALIAEELSATLRANNAQYDFEVSDKGINSPLVAKCPGAVCYSVDQGGGKSAGNVTEGQAPTLTCTHDGAPVIALDRMNCANPACNQGGMAVVQAINGDWAGTLDASYYKGCGERAGVEREVVAYWDGTQTVGTLTANNASGCQRMPDKENFNCVVQTSPRYIVRRLTPLECERLQGFPDGWTDIGEWVDSNGKKRQTSDASRYKALGNSIALPPWKWVLKRICACYERDATMASLFDGIGGFPYLWEQLNGKGTCLWASEIEEFPMAVTKVRIGE